FLPPLLTPPTPPLFPSTTLFRSLQTSAQAFSGRVSFLAIDGQILRPVPGTDSLPALPGLLARADQCVTCEHPELAGLPAALLGEDRKSTRLNSSHGSISYAVFCL